MEAAADGREPTYAAGTDLHWLQSTQHCTGLCHQCVAGVKHSVYIIPHCLAWSGADVHRKQTVCWVRQGSLTQQPNARVVMLTTGGWGDPGWTDDTEADDPGVPWGGAGESEDAFAARIWAEMERRKRAGADAAAA